MNYKDNYNRLIIANHWTKQSICNPFSWGCFEINKQRFDCSLPDTQKLLFCACILGPYRKYKVKINSCPAPFKLPLLLSTIENSNGLVISNDLDKRIHQLYGNYKIHFPTIKPSEFLLYSWADDYYYINFNKDLKVLHELFPVLF